MTLMLTKGVSIISIVEGPFLCFGVCSLPGRSHGTCRAEDEFTEHGALGGILAWGMTKQHLHATVLWRGLPLASAPEVWGLLRG